LRPKKIAIAFDSSHKTIVRKSMNKYLMFGKMMKHT